NYNNTADVASSDYTKWQVGAHSIALDPQFALVGQVVNLGTVSTSGSTLTDTGQNFTTAGIVAGRDFLQIVTTTGTAGTYGIATVGTTTLTTDIALGTGSSVTYQIT